MTPPRTAPHTAFRTVLLTPVDGPPPSTGVPGSTGFEARIHSPAGVRSWLLTTVRPVEPTALRSFVDEHLALDLTAPDAARWRRHADVLHLGRTGPGGARDRLSAVLRAFPGCAVTTAVDPDGTLFVLARTGGRLVLRTSPPTPGLALGSLAHAWLATGGSLTELVALAELVAPAAPAPRPGARRPA
ncbi:hypothetical protein [Kitasatospora purpeofusca]|uniref:hypothetical protein n=1 Tax=Kitasatospora purpeofusca TaxID=67352 RepID=UPI002A5A689A|nr:hypothetical protein [Kitasatospora purpeofusca]MDY0816762.1 hypothetical protein [Kitasatospora purpeofusca]